MRGINVITKIADAKAEPTTFWGIKQQEQMKMKEENDHKTKSKHGVTDTL